MRSTLLALALLAGGGALAQTKSYTYQSVPGDPLGARIYTLENGLQVWLSRNPDAPRIQTSIAVAAGSKHDPADATGLAHYLEHMLFKGTSRIGATDWPREKALLQQISDAYEERRRTTDEAARDRIYRRIDSLSQLAADLAVPNEYDKMVKQLGARGTNAYTSTERTVYINDIPADELERWMAIESERLQECVLRLFHTELETVYEEFNRGQDNDSRKAWEKMNELLYPSHPYGTQTTIGTGDHLKNPSMVRIHEYFSRYYVPNNMALVLAGDLDFDKTIALADRYFGKWKRKPVPAFAFKDDPPAGGVAEVSGPEGEWVTLAWRFPGYKPYTAAALDLIEGLLSNGTAGIIDLDLVQPQRVLEAYAYANVQADYSTLVLQGKPRAGQSIEEVRKLLIGCMEKLVRGDYDDWLAKAVVNDLKLRQTRRLDEQNWARAAEMVDAFILRKEWKDAVGHLGLMATLGKADISAFLGNAHAQPHATVYKRTGEATGRHKVAKPPITPITIKREGKSAWRQEWERMKPGAMEPVFLDFNRAIAQEPIAPGVNLAAVKNPTNDLFTLRYVIDIGTNHDPRIGLALEYLPYLGTSRLSPVELKKQLFRMGLSLTAWADEDRSTITISGLDENLEAGVQLLEELLADAQPDKEAFVNLLDDIRRSKQDDMKEKGVVLFEALFSMARYGERNPFNDGLNDAVLANSSPDDAVKRLQALREYPHQALYYGRRSAGEVAAVLRKLRHLPEKPVPFPEPRAFAEQPTTANRVLLVDHDMVQAELLMVSKAGPFDVEKMPYASLFNEYFGSGLSSIVFQEIREAKALAYGASASYTLPAKRDEAHYVRAFIGTQADKLPEAVDAMLKLMNDMPAAEAQFEGAKASALRVIASTRYTRENILWQWDAARRRGLDYDARRLAYQRIPGITLKDMRAFFDREVKGRPFTYLVIGRADTLDQQALARLGPVTRVSKEQLFGFPER